MSNFVEVFNSETKARIIRRMIAIVLRRIQDTPWAYSMCSAIMFKGFLVTLKIEGGMFKVLLTANDNYVVLFQRNCRYSLVNFSERTREWLELVVFNDAHPYSPVFAANIKQFEVYNNRPRHCTIQEFFVLEMYKPSISYY